MNSDATPPSSLRAALVRRVHGVRGEVRVEPLGGDSARFTPGLTLTVEGSERRLVVRGSRAGADGSVLLAFDGVETPEDARSLHGAYLCVEADAARQLGDNEWFVWRLVGLRCATPDGETLGVVDDVEPAPAADVLVIRDESGRTLRFPMVCEFVKNVDLVNGVITLLPQAEVAV